MILIVLVFRRLVVAVTDLQPIMSSPPSVNVISGDSRARVWDIWEELKKDSLSDNITPVCQGVGGVSSALACCMWTRIVEEESPQVLLEVETTGESSFLGDSPSLSGEGGVVLGAILPCGIEQNVTFRVKGRIAGCIRGCIRGGIRKGTGDKFNEQEGSRGV